MLIKNILNQELVTIEPGSSVRHAGRAMKKHHVSCLIVVKRKSVESLRSAEGIITDRDLMLACLAEGFDPDKTLVSEIMRVKLITIDADQSSFEAVKIMEEYGIHHLPVLDGNGGIEGIITAEDLLRLLADEFSGLSRISERKRKMEADKFEAKLESVPEEREQERLVS